MQCYRKYSQTVHSVLPQPFPGLAARLLCGEDFTPCGVFPYEMVEI